MHGRISGRVPKQPDERFDLRLRHAPTLRDRRHASHFLRYSSEMPTVLTLPFLHLVLQHHEIGVHRGRRWGFREVFGLGTLQNLPFVTLAMKVKQAYEGRRPPTHEGWPAQREALQWLVDKGRDGIYALEPLGIRVKRTPFQRYYVDDGNHRALALYVLGEATIRAHLTPPKPRATVSVGRRTRS